VGFGARELLCHRFRLRRACDLEIVAASAQIDDPLIVRILENADEHPLAQTLAVAAEQLARALTYLGGAHASVVRHETIDGPPYDIERFIPREALTAGADRLASTRLGRELEWSGSLARRE
jgi:hypothetical protein